MLSLRPVESERAVAGHRIVGSQRPLQDVGNVQVTKRDCCEREFCGWTEKRDGQGDHKVSDGLGTTDCLREGRMSVTAFSPKIALSEHILTA